MNPEVKVTKEILKEDSLVLLQAKDSLPSLLFLSLFAKETKKKNLVPLTPSVIRKLFPSQDNIWWRDVSSDQLESDQLDNLFYHEYTDTEKE